LISVKYQNNKLKIGQT